MLWCAAMRHAVLTGELEVRAGLCHLPAERRAVWAARLEDAERARPSDFPNNGWVVEALQAAWSAIATTAVPASWRRVLHGWPGLRSHDLVELAVSIVRGGEPVTPRPT